MSRCYWYSPNIKCFLLGGCKCLKNAIDSCYGRYLPLSADLKIKSGESFTFVTKERKNEY